VNILINLKSARIFISVYKSTTYIQFINLTYNYKYVNLSSCKHDYWILHILFGFKERNKSLVRIT